MKKNYISPAVTEINIEAETMIAASLGFIDTEFDSEDQLSNKRRGEWGNLWNK